MPRVCVQHSVQGVRVDGATLGSRTATVASVGADHGAIDAIGMRSHSRPTLCESYAEIASAMGCDTLSAVHLEHVWTAAQVRYRFPLALL